MIQWDGVHLKSGRLLLLSGRLLLLLSSSPSSSSVKVSISRAGDYYYHHYYYYYYYYHFCYHHHHHHHHHHPVGRFESHWQWDFSRSSHTSDLNIGTPVSTEPGAWHYRVSAGTGWPGVSILWLGQVESLICSFTSVWQHVKLSEQIRPWDTLACCWDVKQPTNKQHAVFSVMPAEIISEPPNNRLSKFDGKMEWPVYCDF